jgi:Reverse transcriptase (RNA-dependent DNA polymerase)
VASVHKQKNWIATIEEEGVQHTKHKDKAKVIHHYFSQLMGSTQNTASAQFRFQCLYSNLLNEEEWQQLQNLITQQEIKNVIQSWPNNKSSGPDDFTGEFFKQFRDIIVPHLLAVFNSVLAAPHQTLAPLNNSYIALIPKKGDASKPTDFRPISLVNSVQKIFSKVLANIMQHLIAQFLTETQTTFVKGRSIMHGFHYAQEVIRMASKRKEEMVVFKADIHKAFDSI